MAEAWDPGAMPGDTLAVRFLTEGGQDPIEVSGWLADYIRAARQSLDLALYDVRLSAGPAALLREALAERIAAGIRVRLVYDAGDKPQSASDLWQRGADPAAAGTDDRVADLSLPPELTRGVRGVHELMHHKYLVRDGHAVWTGSLNLTDDSMARMENIVVTIESDALAALYARDFAELWRSGVVLNSGEFPTAPVPLRYAGQPALTDVDFSPGQGEEIDERIARRVAGARPQIVICSMLLNAGHLLRALLDQLDNGIELWGVYDATQMGGVLDQWREEPELAWKVAAFERIVREGGLVGKISEPYRPGGSHNFMHNKTLVVDDTTVTGSYNFSHSAEANAENVLAIRNPTLAARVAAYTRDLAARFRRAG